MLQRFLLSSKVVSLFFVLLGVHIPLSAQITENKTQLGVQFKPIIPNRFIGHLEQTFQRETTPKFEGNLTQQFGYSAGIAIRHRFTKVFSFETAINFVKRNYTFNYLAIDSNLRGQSNVGFIGYDIPLNGLVYVQIGQQWYMNASAGLNFGFYPTSVQSVSDDANVNSYFKQITSPTRRVQLGININYGFEYRTKDIGTFYIGASYLLPFPDIAVSRMSWVNNGTDYWVQERMNGSYFTADIKYFFPK